MNAWITGCIALVSALADDMPGSVGPAAARPVGIDSYNWGPSSVTEWRTFAQAGAQATPGS